MRLELDADATRAALADLVPVLLKQVTDQVADHFRHEELRPLSVAEASAAMNVSEDTIRRQVSAGLLRRVPGCGAKILITRPSVRALQMGEAEQKLKR